MNNFQFGSLVEFELYSDKKYNPIRGIVVDDNPVFMLDCVGKYSLCYKVSLIEHDKLEPIPALPRTFVRKNPKFNEEAFERLSDVEKQRHKRTTELHPESGLSEELMPTIMVYEFSHSNKKPGTIYYISGSHMRLISE